MSPGVGILSHCLILNLNFVRALFESAHFTAKYVRLVGLDVSPGKCVLLSTSKFQKPTKIPLENPQRGKKRTNFSAGEGKKREILGLPPFGAPPFWAPPFGPELFLGLGHHPEKPPPFGASQFGAPPSADSLA